MKKYLLEVIKAIKATPDLEVSGIEKELVTHFVKGNDKKKMPFSIECFGITFEDKRYEVRRSRQPHFVLEYVVSGKGTVEIEGKKFSVKEGDSYLLDENTIQHYYANKKDPFKKYWVMFSGPAATKMLETYGLLGINHFPNADISDSFASLFALENVSLFSDDICFDASSIIFQMLMILKKSITRETSSIPPSMIKAKRLIDENISGSITIDAICNELSISKPTLIANFKKHFRQTPNAYKNKRRLDLAKMMIKSSGRQIGEIALDLGFPDSYSFSHWFKKQRGITPTEYRKKNEH